MINTSRLTASSSYFRGASFAGLMTTTVLVTSPLPVSAQGTLEEVVVTARYREENIQETPLAISALSSEDISVRGLTSTYEIGYTVPNISLRPTAVEAGGMSAYIRGIGQDNGRPENEPGVAVYFDDVLQPVLIGSLVDLLDLERVEVLRGPQGTLFGRGALGGAIRYISKKPQGDDSGSIELTTGPYDRVDLRASYDFGITDSLFARVSGVAKSRDGYQDVYDWACLNPGTGLPQRLYNREADCKIGTQGGEELTGVRGALRWVAKDELEFTVTADFVDDSSEASANTLIAIATNPSGPFAGQLPVPYNFWDDQQQALFGVRFDERFISSDIHRSYSTHSDPQYGISLIPQRSLNQWGLSGKMEWSLREELRSEVIVAYREFDSAYGWDIDQSPLGFQNQDGRQHFESFTGEIRFSGRAFDRLEWTLGYFHYDGDFANAEHVSMPAFTQGPVLVDSSNLTTSENNSVFGHAVYDITDKLSFTAGLRYSDDTKDENFDNRLVRVTTSTSDSSVDWKVGVDYKLTDHILVYTTAATGYRPQSFSAIAFQPSHIRPAPVEENTSVDVGFKADLFDRSLRVNVAGFWMDYDRNSGISGLECRQLPGTNTYDLAPPGTQVGDVQPGTGRPAVRDVLGNICFNTVPAIGLTTSIPATITGVELEATWRPVDSLTISGAFGYTNYEGDEFDDPALLANPNITEIFSDRPAFVPEYNWSIGIDYQFAMGNGSTLTPRVDVYGQSEICYSITTNLTNPTVTEAQRCQERYELLNLRVEWASPDREWTVAVGATNVTDEEYFLTKTDLTAASLATVTGSPGRPAEWFATFRRNF